MEHDSLVTLPQNLLAPGTDIGARFVLGVDGGATKTLAAVLDLRERSLHLGHGASSNPDAVGTQAAAESLLRATDEALGRADISHVDAAVLAIAGTDTEAVAARVHENHPANWVVVNDVVGAWATATNAQPGVGVISGTGSNIFGVGSDGRAWRAGGWGHVLGDEGSGYWLAVQSIKAALSDRERSGPETALSDAVIDFFGVRSVEALAALVYSKPLTKSELAAFAIETARVAHAGDAVARDLYEHAATELGKQMEAVVRQTRLTGEFPVGLIGSAFKAGALFVEPLSKAIHELAPRARMSVVEMAPVGGCLLLATRVGGREQAISSTQLQTLLDSVLAREGVFRE